MDAVSDIDDVVFVEGYDLFTASAPISRARKSTRRLGGTVVNPYVPLTDFYELVGQVRTIYDYLSVPKAAIFQVLDEEGDIEEVISAEHLTGDYVTEEEFNELKEHVQDIEAILSDASSNLFVVREEE